MAQFVFADVTTQASRVGPGVRQSDVAVRPDQIQSRFPKTGPTHFRPPGELVVRWNRRELSRATCGAPVGAAPNGRPM
jgi:hypothetical protein